MTAWMNDAGGRAPRARIFSSGLAIGAVALLGALAPTAASAAGCPNEEFRLGPSAQLPECRAYELVSPPGKGDGYVLPYYGSEAGVSGGAMAFYSTAAFGGAVSSPFNVLYLARRSQAEGWVTGYVDPPLISSGTLLGVGTAAISDDLGKALVVSKAALTPGAIEGGSNLYLRDNQTGSLTLVKAEAGIELAEIFGVAESRVYVGGSTDWSHLILASNIPLAEGMPAGQGPQHLYDYTDGHFEVIDRLPDGEVSPEGALVQVETAGGRIYRTVSSDGSRVYFTAGSAEPGPLYMREDDSRTVPISVSQKHGPGEGEVKPVTFVGAAADGSVAYFLSSEDLTDEANAETNGNTYPSLYRYELASGKLTDITPLPAGNPGGAFVLNVVSISADGSYVYFDSKGALTAGASETGQNLYVWHDGVTRLISDEAGGAPAMASPNGEYLAFATEAPLTSDDVPTSHCPEGAYPEHCVDVFVYEYANEKITCASCGGPALGGSSIGTLGETYLTLRHNARAVLDNGSVFFNTPNNLAPRDSNGLEDVYLWRHGVASLISTGTSNQPSNFADASPDGTDAFFFTAQGLVGVDTDGISDVYDARVDGGLAAQNPPGTQPPCDGEACRGVSPAAPSRSRVAISAGPASTCTEVARRAHHLAAVAKRAEKRAGSVSGPRGRRLRGIAAKRRAAAKRARSRAGHCRRAGA